MNDEPKHRTSRAGMIFVLLAFGGSAIGVVGWYLNSNRNAGLDTSGFDMSTAPGPANSAARPPIPASAPSAAAPAQQTSLGMIKGGAGMLVVDPAPKASASSGAAAAPANPKEDAALALKAAAINNETQVRSFIMRMQAKHPSISQYGKDWAASPELRALRDQYWANKDPLKFAYGLAKSNDFGKLLKKYATDPGMREALIMGMKEAPPGLLGAIGGIFKNDNVAKDLVSTVLKAVGLPASLTGFLNDDGAKPPDQNQIMSGIMNSDEMKKAMKNTQSPAALDQKSVDKAKETAPNGFTPLGGR